MSTSSQIYIKQQESIPKAHIILDIPRRTDNFPITNTSYQQDLSTVSQTPLDQTFDLKLSILPGDKKIFDMEPRYFLYRYTSRTNRNSAFRNSGKKLVHPSDTSINLVGHRYRGGQHNNGYALLPRVTEVDAVINTHSVTGDFEWYGGSEANPDGTKFPFTPLAWMSYSQDIANAGIQFPQPLYQGNSNGTFDAGIGIENKSIQLSNGNPRYTYFPTNTSRKSIGKTPKRQYYGIQLMVKNPEFVGGSQVPEYLACSNMVEFVVDYKVVTLVDPVDSIVRKYAIDWRIRHNNAL